MKTFILNIPRQQHRTWALLGHLDTKGFPVNKAGLVRVWNGFDFQDFETYDQVIEKVESYGYKNHGLENSPHKSDKVEWRHELVTLGMRNILRMITGLDEPVLVIENDSRFYKGEFDFGFLLNEWATLTTVIGYEHINAAMLFYYETHELQPVREVERISGFWGRGSRSLGQVANIYTPHGANLLLQQEPFFPSIETYLGTNPDMPGLFTAYENQIDLHFFANFDSDGLASRNPEFWFNYYRGDQL